MQTFISKLVNDRRREEVVVEELNGELLCVLAPGQRMNVESASPLTLFSRWDTATWNDDGTVALHPRSGFKEPDRGKWTLNLLNEQGAKVEHRDRLGFALMKNIPVTVGVDLHNPLVVYQSLTLHAVLRKHRDPDWPGIIVGDWELLWEGVLRPQSELDEIQSLLDAEITKAEATT